MYTGWSHKRKFIYGGTIIIALALLFTYIFRDTLFSSPTCFDGKHNGFETGRDCGGACSLRCSQDVFPLSVDWSRAVRTSSTTYDFLALISNKNIDNAPRTISYTFIAYDVAGNEMTRIEGRTVAPIDGDFPIIKQNVTLPQQPGEITVVLQSNVPHYKVLEKPTVPTLRIVNSRYEEGAIPRVYATIINQKRILLRDLPVRVFLYDADGNVYAGGETVISSLDKESSQDIVFTWNKAFPFAPTKIRVFPILDPFLGSL